jgi:hypothetical protein
MRDTDKYQRATSFDHLPADLSPDRQIIAGLVRGEEESRPEKITAQFEIVTPGSATGGSRTGVIICLKS